MRKVLAVGVTTFRESVRSKILYSTLFFAILLVLVAALFGSVTIGDQVKVIKDFGLFAISLFTVAFAVISGTALLFKELSKKTVYNILAKAVYRWEFLLGKYVGMLLTAALMLFIMGVGLSGFAAIFEQRIDFMMWQAYLFIFFELIIICAAAIFFSAVVVTPLLSGLFTFGIFLAGRSSDYLTTFAADPAVPDSLRLLLRLLHVALPHLDSLYIANETVWGVLKGWGDVLWSAVYACSYAGALLVLSTIVFQRREFN